MPAMRITHYRGALTDSQKAAIADELTPALLIADAGADTPAGRSLAYVIFDEVDPKTSWFVGGKPDLNPPVGGRFLFDVVIAAGAASQTVKTELHAKINQAIAKTFGVDGTFPNRAGDWVLVHEVAEGNWGASGITIGIAEIHGALGGAPERVAYFEQHLAAQKRLREAHSFPAGAGRESSTNGVHHVGISFEAFETAARAQGFDGALVLKGEPFGVLEDHTHPFAFKALVAQGEFWLTIDGVTSHLQVGDTCEVAHEKPHAERYGVEGVTIWVAHRNDA